MSAVVTTFATCGYGVVSWLQWRALDAQLTQTKEQFGVQHRPWVGVDDSVVPRNVVFTTSTTFQFQFELSIRNYGASPALKAGIGAAFAMSTEEANSFIKAKIACQISQFVNISDVPAQLQKALINRQTIFPNQVIQVPTAVFHGTSAITDGVFLVGCIPYTDMFGAARRTEFCYVSPFKNVLDDKAAFRQCPFGNSAE